MHSFFIEDLFFLFTMSKQCSFLTRRYGDLYTMELGPFRSVMVNELSLAQDMFSKDVFNGRFLEDTVFGEGVLGSIRGGKGHHGIIPTMGKEWREQRRFALRYEERIIFIDKNRPSGNQCYHCYATSGS